MIQKLNPGMLKLTNKLKLYKMLNYLVFKIIHFFQSRFLMEVVIKTWTKTSIRYAKENDREKEREKGRRRERERVKERR